MPGVRIPYILPTQHMATRVLLPIVEMLQVSAPAGARCAWNTQEGALCFANGSRIFVAGTDNKQYERMRGLNIGARGYVDEAGFCRDLQYILHDILTPATMTGGGRLVLASTPSVTASHDWYYVVQDAKSRGSCVVRTIDDNTALDDDTRRRYVDEAGGATSSTARREYYCEFVTDSGRAVIPEFDDKAEAELVKDIPLPRYYNYYGALDPGFRHFTGYLLGYYDFDRAVYVVYGERLLQRKNTAEVAEATREVEVELFGTVEPFLRVSDTASQVIHDMLDLWKVAFVATAKDNLEAQVNRVRTLVQSRRLIIHPRCGNLVRQLRSAVWTESRKAWEESERDGHMDLLAALVYLIRAIDPQDNPYPDVMPEHASIDIYRIEKHNGKDKINKAFGL